MPGTENGRVTMGNLSTKLDTVIKKLDQIEERAYEDHDRIMYLEGGQSEHARQIETMQGDISKVEGAVKIEGGIQALLIAALTALGIMK